MSLLHVQYFSAALRKQSGMFVVIPDGDGPFPTLYLLHGLSDDYTGWVRHTGVERYAMALGLIVVMPDGGRAYYTDLAHEMGRYEGHILDAVTFIDRTFRTVVRASGRGIGGLSMGGYGAMKLGLKYPELFGSITAHSGALDRANTPLDPPDLYPEYPFVFTQPPDADADCFALAARPGAKPAIRIDCGTEDHLLRHSRDFHAHLMRLGIPHEYAEFPGAHTWEYWDQHVQTALQFHARHFAAMRGEQTSCHTAAR